MWMPWIITCFALSLWLFVRPYHRPKPEYAASGKPRTLLAVILHEGRWRRGVPLKRNLLAAGFCVSLCVVFLPPAILWQLSLLTQQGITSMRSIIMFEAIALIVGGGMTIVVMILSDMIIGFGSPVRTTVNTHVAYLLPVYEFGFALAAIIATSIL